MNNKYIWITIGVILLIVILYLIYKAMKKNTTVVITEPIIPSPKTVGNVNGLNLPNITQNTSSSGGGGKNVGSTSTLTRNNPNYWIAGHPRP